MENFVQRENVKLYRRLLAETTDEHRRQTLLKLLADEEAKDPQSFENSRPKKTRPEARPPDGPEK
jgi:hypothetical protein